ncbi:T9SS type A sorting domain-containing protein [Hymenobacter monticola]|uniref:T9SS type A sorting domain-containing protein n=1 Tax=Hymenobacter monticola TaxID=1705399 RepID=A0ABY4AYP9_9BACT|nr:T9SS type A sorting domain-containing protein [Hymenobacter monticola]UOE32017.1 T9SS type A sorting domain-containing protein [Hymenobacter monticola]
MTFNSLVSINAFAQSQCTYRAINSGSFSSASTWSSTCGGAPTPGSDDIIIIEGFNVSLDVNYQVGKNGSISVLGGGSLVGGSDLRLGDGTGAQVSTRLTVAPGSTVRVAQLTVNKATVTVDAPLNAAAPTTLATDCNLVLMNSNITDNSRVIINGNVDVTGGGANNTLCGTGSVRITGCVYGGNGAVNKLANNCAASLVTTVCAQQATTGCPGPVAGANANERACDALVTACPRPLPVELVIFSATATDKKQVALHWVTASEKNSRNFVVERSMDGKTFRDFATVEAAGSSQTQKVYDFTDEQPLPGTSYYRLRQVDLDGTANYSSVRTVKLGSASSHTLAVYPGGTARQWTVLSTLPAEALVAPATVQVFDAVGRLQKATPVADASQTGRWALDLGSLPTGVYIVRLITVAGTFSQRIAQ